MSASERIVIVGAGPAGLAVARACREHGGTGQVTLLGAEPHPPYERPPLTDLVLLGMGVQPRGELAADAGLSVLDGAILTDSQMRAHERVFAAGDVAYAHNSLAGRRLRVEHWGDALGQGEIAGHVLAGEDVRWQDVPGFWSTIGRRTIKHAAGGDGYDACRLVEHPGGAFTVWYTREDALVGVLTHERDEDYERGRQPIAAGQPAP